MIRGGISSQPPKVSVVMPLFNAEPFVAQTIASVQAQSVADWELLVVDDGSTDRGAAAVRQMAETDARITLLTLTGQSGAGPARNMGLDHATGQYIAFLDADDLWHPSKLARQLAAMEQAGNAPLCCTGVVQWNMRTETRTQIGVPERITRRALLRTNLIACSSAMFDRAHFAEHRMAPLKRRQDFAFWLDLLSKTPYCLGLSEPLTTHRQHDMSLSHRQRSAALATWHLYRAHLGLSYGASAFYFGQYALRAILRHKTPALAHWLGIIHPVHQIPDPGDDPA